MSSLNHHPGKKYGSPTILSPELQNMPLGQLPMLHKEFNLGLGQFIKGHFFARLSSIYLARGTWS